MSAAQGYPRGKQLKDVFYEWQDGIRPRAKAKQPGGKMNLKHAEVGSPFNGPSVCPVHVSEPRVAEWCNKPDYRQPLHHSHRSARSAGADQVSGHGWCAGDPYQEWRSVKSVAWSQAVLTGFMVCWRQMSPFLVYIYICLDCVVSNTMNICLFVVRQMSFTICEKRSTCKCIFRLCCF